MAYGEGIDLSVRTIDASGGKHLRPLSAAQRRELGKHSLHDLQVFARSGAHDSSTATAMLAKAGKESALAGRTDDARRDLRDALSGLHPKDEMSMRRRLHAFFIGESRKVKGTSLGLSIDLMEIAAELIQPVDREASIRLRLEVANQHELKGRCAEAGYQHEHIAELLRKDDPPRAMAEAVAAINGFLKAAIKLPGDSKIHVIDAAKRLIGRIEDWDREWQRRLHGGN
jgi:hypothetical protein